MPSRFSLSLLSVSFLLAAFALGPSCSRQDSANKPDSAQPAAILRLGNGAEPQDLDPHLITAFTDMQIGLALFEGLTVLDEKTSAPVPAAAESWNVSPDGLIWTFHLRPSLRWSDDTPLTAIDFVASWRRALSPKLAAEYAYLLFPIKNAEALASGKITDAAALGAEAVDERTIRLHLNHPTPYLASLAASAIWAPVPLSEVSRYGAPDARGTGWTLPGHLVGNGPFILREWEPHARITVARNPHYWDAAAVQLDGIEFYPTENPEAEERAYRAGQLDITADLPLSKVEAYRRDDPASLRVEPFLETFFVRFNTTRPPLNDPRVRRALSLAIDRDLLTRTLLRGTREPARHFTPPGCAGFTATAHLQPDPAAARALLAEAGFPDGRGFPTLEVIVRNNEIHTRTMEAIQGMWRSVLGLNVTLSPLEQKTWIARQSALDFDLATARWVGDFMDPVTFLDMFVTAGGNNWTGWSNARYDSHIAAAAAAPDATARYTAFQKAEALLLDESPIAPVFFGARLTLVRPRVGGWEPSLLGFHQYKKVYVRAP